MKKINMTIEVAENGLTEFITILDEIIEMVKEYSGNQNVRISVHLQSNGSSDAVRSGRERLSDRY